MALVSFEAGLGALSIAGDFQRRSECDDIPPHGRSDASSAARAPMLLLLTVYMCDHRAWCIWQVPPTKSNVLIRAVVILIFRWSIIRLSASIDYLFNLWPEVDCHGLDDVVFAEVGIARCLVLDDLFLSSFCLHFLPSEVLSNSIDLMMHLVCLCLWLWKEQAARANGWAR